MTNNKFVHNGQIYTVHQSKSEYEGFEYLIEVKHKNRLVWSDDFFELPTVPRVYEMALETEAETEQKIFN